jgi:drug/metabolite transporter (DMT)-like permease
MTNSSPLLLVIAGLLFFRQRIGALEIGGTVAGFVGVALLSLSDLQLTGDVGSTVLGSLFAIGSSAAWAAYTAIARRLGRADPLITTAITSAIGSAVLAAIAIPTQNWGNVSSASWEVLVSTAWAGAMATGCTYAAWSFALRRLPAIAVAPFAYLIPVSALTISHFWLGEPITPAVIGGALLVLAGVALSQARPFLVLVRAEGRSIPKL